MKRTALKRSKPLRPKKPMKRTHKQVSQEIKDHWARVARLGCCVTFTDNPTIHHCHGGSIATKLRGRGMPGIGQRQNHWLVIPLAARLHTGQDGIDNGLGMNVAKWEQRYGSQFEYLQKVREQIQRRYGYDMFLRAKILEDE